MLGSRSRLLRAALFSAGLVSLLLASAALAAVGGLTQPGGVAGCISGDGTGGACTQGTALNVPNSVTTSPDGESVYVVSQTSNAVAIFDRNPTTGALAQKPGAAGCISETGDGGTCADGAALAGAFSVSVSPDGENVYVAAFTSDAVAIFDRNPTTGALTQKPGTAGCISESGSGGTCTDGNGLDAASSIEVSPDGSNVYAAALLSDAITIFDRNPTTGALTQKAGTAGCISEDGSGGACADGNALDGVDRGRDLTRRFRGLWGLGQRRRDHGVRPQPHHGRVGPEGRHGGLHLRDRHRRDVRRRQRARFTAVGDRLP